MTGTGGGSAPPIGGAAAAPAAPASGFSVGGVPGLTNALPAGSPDPTLTGSWNNATQSYTPYSAADLAGHASLVAGGQTPAEAAAAAAGTPYSPDQRPWTQTYTGQQLADTQQMAKAQGQGGYSPTTNLAATGSELASGAQSGAPVTLPGSVNASPVPTPTANPLATQLGAAAGVSPAGSTATGVTGSPAAPYDLSKITPGGGTDLTSQLITPGAGADRLALANKYQTNWQNQTNPQFQADLRDAMRRAAGGGAIGSGALNTSLGDITGQRDIQRNAAMSNFLTNAEGGSIEDAFRKTGIAQQQQGFQAGQQGTAFNQAMQQAMFGEGGDPTQLLLQLSQMYGNQAAGAGAGVNQLIAGNSGLSQQQLQQLIAAIGPRPAATS